MKRWPFSTLAAAGFLASVIGRHYDADPIRIAVISCMTLLAAAFFFAIKDPDTPADREIERLRKIIAGCPVCSDLERNIKTEPRHGD